MKLKLKCTRSEERIYSAEAHTKKKMVNQNIARGDSFVFGKRAVFAFFSEVGSFWVALCSAYIMLLLIQWYVCACVCVCISCIFWEVLCITAMYTFTTGNKTKRSLGVEFFSFIFSLVHKEGNRPLYMYIRIQNIYLQRKKWTLER